MKVVCVLKSGGDYNWRYVNALRNAFDKHLSLKYDFYCFSDMKGFNNCNKLLNNWPGWWSKLEALQLNGPAIYADLDTVILGNLDPWAEAVQELSENQFMMLKALHPHRQWASGLMAWNGNYSWLCNEFVYEKRPHNWDQVYIERKLLGRRVEIKAVQNYLPGVYSYKRHCRNYGGPPEGSRIVYFHGHPRPHEVDDQWVKENWGC